MRESVAKEMEENENQDAQGRQIGFLPHNYLGRVEKSPDTVEVVIAAVVEDDGTVPLLCTSEF